MQTVQTLIRLLLQEQSDQDLNFFFTTKYFEKLIHVKKKKQDSGKTSMPWSAEILGHLQ